MLLFVPLSRSRLVPITACIIALAIAAGCSSGDDPAAATEAPCEPGFITQVISVDYGAQAGFGQGAMPLIVFGPPQGAGLSAGSLDVVSLGLGGSIVVGFAHGGISDGPGADFIVFENAFFAGGDPSRPFAEPGTVSVSLDAESWVPFPCESTTPPYPGCAGVHPVLANTDAGVSPFDPGDAGGEAFDLAEAGISSASYVRIDGAQLAATAAGTSGFDLDAVAVLHPACP